MLGPYGSTRYVALLIIVYILVGHWTSGAVQPNISAPETTSKMLPQTHKNKTNDIPEPDVEKIVKMKQLPTGRPSSRLLRDHPIAWVDDVNLWEEDEAKDLENKKAFVHDGLGTVIKQLQGLGYEVVFGDDVSDFDLIYTRYNLYYRHASTRIHTKAMVNHLPGMYYLAFKAEFVTDHRYLSFIPEAYNLPDDNGTFRIIAESNPDQLWIHKNEGHRGVNLVRAEDIDLRGSGVFVQHFLTDLHLIDGRRYDIGIFVTLTSLDPLRAYVYNDWVVRFCPDEFLPFNSFNRRSYVIEPGHGFKLMIAMPSLRTNYLQMDHHKRNALLAYLSHEGYNITQLQDNLHDAIRKTLLHKVPKMIPILKEKQETISNNAYEMLRFDFMLGRNMEVYLLEANLSPDIAVPSYSPLDFRTFYHQLIYRLFSLVGIASAYGWPVTQWTEKELDMEVWDRNIRVNANRCVDKVCTTNCTSEECMLCSECLEEDDVYTLKRTYLEHMNRKTWRRVFPEPFKSQSDAQSGTVQEHYTTKNKMLSLWFREKCLDDATWCT